jgi:hypothetical protein
MWFEQKIAKDAKTRESPNLFAAFATFVFLLLRQFFAFAALGLGDFELIPTFGSRTNSSVQSKLSTKLAADKPLPATPA